LLKSLTYSTTFPSTGRTLSGQFDFRKGFGTITGKNEAGKSFVIEMVRYCLFGSAALRGKAENYKKLVASLGFDVKGATFTVNRKSTGATLFRGSEQIATGTRPVNAKIADVLGFGLEVFDLACVSNQGELERLGTMKPAERQRMVDSTIGMSVIDDLARWATDQSLEKTREVETIERICVKPVGPVPPADYRPSSEIQVQIAAGHVNCVLL
jgi:DNA repair protein SbcC/Rad50